MAEEIRRLFHEFRGGKISRREFMRRAIMIIGKYPGIIAIHENCGLTDHIRGVARRFANSQAGTTLGFKTLRLPSSDNPICAPRNLSATKIS